MRYFGRGGRSIAWYENQPLSVLEAMACGTPLVVTDMGGLPELVSHEQTGIVVPAEDASALAQALRQVSGETATRFGDAAHRHARTSFSRQTHLRRLSEVYADVLEQEGHDR